MKFYQIISLSGFCINTSFTKDFQERTFSFSINMPYSIKAEGGISRLDVLYTGSTQREHFALKRYSFENVFLWTSEKCLSIFLLPASDLELMLNIFSKADSARAERRSRKKSKDDKMQFHYFRCSYCWLQTDFLKLPWCNSTHKLHNFFLWLHL